MKPSNLIYSFSIALVTLLPTVSRKICINPKLNVKIKLKGYSLEKRWLSKSTHGVTNRAMFVYEVCWKYQVIIHNDSDYDAYYPKLRFGQAIPLSILNHYIPIDAHETIILEGEYKCLKELSEDADAIPEKFPPIFHGLTLLLEYQNSDKDKFYTFFDFKYQINDRLRLKPAYFN